MRARIDTHIYQTAAGRAGLCHGGFVYCDVTSEKSAQLWDDVRFLGPFVGSAQLWESACLRDPTWL